jgi:threonine synthase
MRYLSTRDPAQSASLSEALRHGIAPDGGLYVPESFPLLTVDDFAGLQTIPEIGTRLLEPFFAGDRLAGALAEICREALDFAIPLRPLRERTAVLELFHGPTAAFKDVGARFLARCLARLPAEPDRPRTVLVATSGDTGGAVAAAFHGQPGIEVVILFPKGRISARQETQLTCWGGNVTSLAVRGDFDDCQRLVKAAFADPELRARRELTSANSINLGRLLPQMIYYAAASLRHLRDTGVEPGFVIPSGNVGNAAASLWARECGLPIREVVLATNANPVIPEYLATGEWRPRATVPTLANAMDVGNPSNMERIFHLFPDVESLRRNVSAYAVTDAAIREQIRQESTEWGEIWDPHTATAVHVREQLGGGDWILVATAHPAKFESIVEPLIGRAVPVPPPLEELLTRPSHAVEIQPTLEALREVITAAAGAQE